ncbi:BFH_HP2_G0046940.mRNA.1.CDS.1 [Saccharomyces cerevisiae]|nr:BFH_HP2_G0046940.mRNA.1.CDS.1 [Saccharomyces cerevisiae]CAI6750861.1 BFH_HP2_G0046940.mRNA.1.CDS.1 [Saccharomyces cerevisiae]
MLKTTIRNWCPIPDTFDASAIIGTFVKEASEQGIHLRKAGVTMENISVEGLDSTFLEGQTFGDILCLQWTIIKGIHFAIACKMPSKRVNDVTKAEYIATNRDFWHTIFGLTHTYDTRVGNDFVSGVSGGNANVFPLPKH